MVAKKKSKKKLSADEVEIKNGSLRAVVKKRSFERVWSKAGWTALDTEGSRAPKAADAKPTDKEKD